MHHFAYRDGVLHAEGVNLDTLAREVGTPFYCYSTATLERHYRVFAGAFADVQVVEIEAIRHVRPIARAVWPSQIGTAREGQWGR